MEKALAFGKGVLTRRVREILRRPATQSLEEWHHPRSLAGPWKRAWGLQVRHALARGLKGLSKPLRKVFLLRERRGWTTAEIAEREGVSEAAIRKRISRARQELREDGGLWEHTGS